MNAGKGELSRACLPTLEAGGIAEAVRALEKPRVTVPKLAL